VERHQRVRRDRRQARGRFAGSAKIERPSIDDLGSLVYTIDVGANVDRLDVAIGNTSDASADLDLISSP